MMSFSDNNKRNTYLIVLKNTLFPLLNNQTYVTRHAKRYELGGRRHFEKIRLKVNVASRKNSTSTHVVSRRLTFYKTG